MSRPGKRASLERAKTPLQELTGSKLPKMISWEGLGLDIVFTSDGSVNKKGFEADVAIGMCCGNLVLMRVMIITSHIFLERFHLKDGMILFH